MNRIRLQLIVAVAALVVAAPVSVFGAVTGRVVDAQTNKPISGAVVALNGVVAQTDAGGAFSFQNSGDTVTARAHGYMRAEQAVAPPPQAKTFSLSAPKAAPLEIKLPPFTPKALYLTFYGIGDRGIRNNALKLISETELNALVIDVKGDRGAVTYKTAVPLASEIGGQKLIIVKDIKGLIASMKERGVYTIARIVVFKDNLLAEARNDLAIRTTEGKLWRDRENLMWVDASKKEVWDYNIALAVEAAQNGFDEIQFDYVRFPDRKGLKFAVANTEENRVNAIAGFLAAAKKRLAPYNVFLAADIFGYVPWNPDDTQIGQRLDKLVPNVDYICLMLYPSGFQFGIPGHRNPVADSYEIIYKSLKKSQERTNISTLRFRPWLQAFRDYAFDRRFFTGTEIRSQIKASEDFGANGWMLWNPRNVYTAEGLRKETAAPYTTSGVSAKPVVQATADGNKRL